MGGETSTPVKESNVDRRDTDTNIKSTFTSTSKYIYVLGLENNKYYIGKTVNPDIRIDDHSSSNGSYWTKMYKPNTVIEIIPNCDDFDEDKYTLKYMGMYGINNVRGGSFCEIILSTEIFNTITHMLKSTNGMCYICGNIDHLASACGQIPQNKCSKCKRIGHLTEDCNAGLNCTRCQRTGHLVEACYAKTHTDGSVLESIPSIDTKIPCRYCGRKFDTSNGAKYHENKFCKNNNKITSSNGIKFPCRYCGKEFDTLNGTKYHENIHCKRKK